MANWSRSQINEVRQWLAINGKDIRYLADHISENYNTLKDYISPNTRRKEIPDTRLRNLYHLTKLECLKTYNPSLDQPPQSPPIQLSAEDLQPDSKQELINALDSLESRILATRDFLIGNIPQFEIPVKFDDFRLKFYNLIASLESLKKVSPKDIEILKKVVPITDVGYAISLLNAFYKDDQLRGWVLKSNYTVKGRK